MCARATLIHPEVVLEFFDATSEVELVTPRYNIAPTQPIAALRVGADGGRHLDLLRWGLVPAWAKTPKIGGKFINARGETLFEAPAFRGAAEARRCVVVVDGFYEWEHVGKTAQPYLFRRADGLPFGLAGAWERWRAGDGSTMESCSVVTAEAAAPVEGIHDRMAVVLDRGEVAVWLDPAVSGKGAKERLAPLLRKRARPELVAMAVSTRVNSAANDDAGCLAPAGEMSGGQRRLPFG